MNVGEQLRRGDRPAAAVRRDRIGMRVSDQRKALGVACAPRRRPGHRAGRFSGRLECAVANAARMRECRPARRCAPKFGNTRCRTSVLDDEHRRDEDRACDVGETATTPRGRHRDRACMSRTNITTKKIVQAAVYLARVALDFSRKRSMQQARKSRAKRLAVAQKRVSEHDGKHQVRTRVLGEEHACEMMLDQRPTEPDGGYRGDRCNEHGSRAPPAVDRRCQETRERNKREPCAEQGLMEPLDDRDMRRNREYARRARRRAPRGLATRSGFTSFSAPRRAMRSC